MILPDLVMVAWIDAAHSKDTPEGFGAECLAVGYVVDRTEDGIRLASEWGPDDEEFRFHIDIPVGLIRWEAPLRWPEGSPV